MDLWFFQVVYQIVIYSSFQSKNILQVTTNCFWEPSVQNLLRHLMLNEITLGSLLNL